MKKMLSVLVLVATLVAVSWYARDALRISGFDLPFPEHGFSWFQDARFSLLQERVAALEVQQRRIPILEERLQGMTALEARLDRLQLLEKRVGVLESGFVLAKKRDAAWTLTNVFSRQRQYRRDVLFSRPFPEPPRIVLGITLINLPGEKVHFLARAEAIHVRGFTMVFETRSDSRVEEVQVDWLAFSSGREEIPTAP